MEKSYSLGYQIKRSIQYSISFTFVYLQPTVTGPSSVFSETNNYFTIDVNGYDIERIRVTNASYTFDSTTGELVIYNVTNDVTVRITASSTKLCTLELVGHFFTSSGDRYGYWPATGRIKYMNKYGVEETFNVADAGLGAQTQTYYLTDKILEGTDVVCTNIALGTNYGTPSSRDVEFYQGPSESSQYLVYTGPGTGSSYTFENVQSSGSSIPAVIIAASGY